MRLAVEVEDVKAFRGLLEMSVRADKMRPLLEDFQDDVETLNAKRFSGDARPRWKKNAPATVRQKGSKPVGVDSGDLQAAMTRKGAKGAVREVTADELRVGTDLFYARFFSAGTGSQPKRKLTALGKVDRKRWADALIRFVVKGNR